MFWMRQRKTEDAGARWTLAYGDLMSLLLAVFVMIAAMSELRSGPRFALVRDGVRGAFGFAGAEASTLEMLGGAQRPVSLLERLTQAGLRGHGIVQGGQLEDEALAPCDVLLETDRVIIRIAGPACFDAFSARLKPAGQRAMERLAAYLAGGQACLEICGHNGDGPLPEQARFRDAWDLSYERARMAAETLVQGGVARPRLRITAWGDHAPLAAGSAAGGNRRIEIIVHAAAPAGPPKIIAEKERGQHG